MSYAFPGEDFNAERTQPIKLSTIKANLDDWAKTEGGGQLGAPTYKSNNNTAAYFKFMQIQDKELSNYANDFVHNPDQPKYNEYRKYMIVLVNILMSEFNDNIKFNARSKDYNQLCQLAGQSSISGAFRKWAMEIDPNKPEKFIEICAEVEEGTFPVAMYSDTNLRIYPRNMINPAVLTRFIGYDRNPESGLNNFTMKALKRDLDKMPPGPKTLYAELNYPSANFQSIQCVNCLSQWLASVYEVTDPATHNPITLTGTSAVTHIDGSGTLNIPRFSPPYRIGTSDCVIFSEKLLIIKANKNVREKNYRLCSFTGADIGCNSEEVYAVIPPISEELIEIMRQNPDNVKFESCSIKKNAENNYNVVMTLLINGSTYIHHHSYFAGNVCRCNNFPLLTVLSMGDKNNPFPARIHRSNYPKDEKTPKSYIDGSSNYLMFGHDDNTGDGYELSLNVNLPASEPSDFRYIGVRYKDNNAATTAVSFGYLLFDDTNTIYNVALNASSTAAVIDAENNVAKIAIWDNHNVNSYDVYNDKILFITKNNRKDFDDSTGKIWGTKDRTIFSIEKDTKYAIAPYSREFAKMIAENKITIGNATLSQAGNKYEFFVTFTDLTGTHQTAPKKLYDPKTQFVCENAPFIYAVDTLDEKANPGYEVVLVPNMNSNSIADNSIDSNELKFIMNNSELNPSQFTKSTNKAYIQILGGTPNNPIYYGQVEIPFNHYTWSSGFCNLYDEKTGCAPVLLVNSLGTNKPKQIITGRVFDDNILFIKVDESRVGTSEYEAWHKNNLIVPVANIDNKLSGNYEAIFPLSLKMLQNLNKGFLSIIPGTPSITYNENTNRYNVFVKLQNGIECKMEYTEDKIKVCDNLPFVVSLKNRDSYHLVRFSNALQNAVPRTIDSDCISIDYIKENEAKKIFKSDLGKHSDEFGEITGDDNVILKLTNENISYHVLYNLSQCSLHEGVYAVQSKITSVQHVFDYSIDDEKPNVNEINVFTEYMMYTNAKEHIFANNANAQVFGTENRKEIRIYSIPITMEFSNLMEKRNITISSYNDIVYSTDPNRTTTRDSDLSNGLYVTINFTGIGDLKMTKKYEKDKILSFESYPLPTLTVFPFVNFIDNQNRKLWNEYSYAKIMKKTDTPSESRAIRTNQQPLGSRVEFWINGECVNFQNRSTKIMESQSDNNANVMSIAKVNGWGTYIHMKYDGSGRFAAAQPVDRQWDGQELGCIMVQPPEPINVASNNEAVVGVDFGTRNTIIAIKSPAMINPIYPYHGDKDLQKIIIPCMTDYHKSFSNLSYIPHFDGRPGMPSGNGKFSSTVMLYTKAYEAINDNLYPYDLGFVPNVQGDVLNKIMERLSQPGAQQAMGDIIGFYSDLKISSKDNGGDNIMERNVSLFIKSLLFHIVLNCYMKNCGRIRIRISFPSEDFKDKMASLWTDAKDYMERLLVKDTQNVIIIGEYATEADALFETISKQNYENMTTYSAITDGGDGTYDFTINRYDIASGNMSNIDAFSLRYAGKQIMTDSINVFFDNLVRRENNVQTATVKKIFKDLWNAPQSQTQMQNLDKLIDQVGKYHTPEYNDPEGRKTVVLMLVEQFGINCNNLFNSNPKNIIDTIMPNYNNFVRMIQYKFLFLFNVLGEHINKKVNLSETDETGFNIFLYGGTAQALAIIEPLCRGKLSVYKDSPYSLPMVSFIDTMMNLRPNRSGAKIALRFIPAQDSEKREIAHGLITKNPLPNFKDGGGAAMAGIAPGMGGLGMPDSQNSSQNPFGSDPFGSNNQQSAFGGGGSDPFGSFGGNPFGSDPFGASNNQNRNVSSPASSNEVDSKRPERIEDFIDYLKDFLQSRTIAIGGNHYSIDRFLPFIAKREPGKHSDKLIYLSEILDVEAVRNNLAAQLNTMWQNVRAENRSITDADLIFHIFTLKMVSFAIETYLSL